MDLFVWVTDPQKYADARCTMTMWRPWPASDAVMLVVLNRVDRLTPTRSKGASPTSKRLLVRDGVRQTTVLSGLCKRAPAWTRSASASPTRLPARLPSRTRLAADVRSAAQRLAGGVADDDPRSLRPTSTDDRCPGSISRSAMVVDAVARDYRMEATGHIGWPFTRWVQAFRPRPLRRLRLGDKTIGCATRTCDPSWAGRPTAQPSGRAAVALATRNLARVAGAGLPTPWADAVDAAADPPGSLTDDLDRAVVATRCAAATPSGGA